MRGGSRLPRREKHCQTEFGESTTGRTGVDESQWTPQRRVNRKSQDYTGIPGTCQGFRGYADPERFEDIRKVAELTIQMEAVG